MEVFREGYRIPFLWPPSLSAEPILMPSYAPTSIKRAALEEVTLALIAKGAVELAPLPSPGFYSRLFVVWKTSGSWRPVIDLSLLNRFVDVSHFRMETIQSVLSVRQGDWMASIDLREAYLQVPVHPEPHRFLRFVAHGRTYQFTALCFGLSTAPQVFTRVMASVSTILHSLGIRMSRYLDDWLVQASSREDLLRDLGVVLSLLCELGIVVNPGKSNFSPSQVVQYLGVIIDASFCQLVAVAAGDVVLCVTSGSRGLPADEMAPDLPSPLLGSVGSFDSCAVVSGLSSGPSVVASRGLPLSRGLSPSGIPRSRLLVRRFRRRLGAHLGDRVVSGLWHQSEALLPVNSRELLAVRHGLLHFQSFLSRTTAAVFCDNVTTVAYLCKEGGTRSPAVNTIAQEILRWMESLQIRLAPQFIPGIRILLADSLSRPHQLPSSESSLNMDVFRSLMRQWPVMIDLFAISDNHRCSIYFSPYRDPLLALRTTPSRGPPSPRWRISSGGSTRFGALVSPPSRAIDRCSSWCLSSISLPSLATWFFGTCCVPLRCLLHPTRCVLLTGTSRQFCVF